MTSSANGPRWRIYVALGGTALAMYLGTYTALSLQGKYEATVWGVNGVKNRRWVPKGFESNGDWNLGMIIAFLPLYYTDLQYWHTSGKADSGRYPVNTDDYYMFGMPVKGRQPP